MSSLCTDRASFTATISEGTVGTVHEMRVPACFPELAERASFHFQIFEQCLESTKMFFQTGDCFEKPEGSWKSLLLVQRG